MMNTEQSRAFLTESMHALLMDIFYVEISRSEDSTEVQSIESLIQKYDRSGDGSEISDTDVRNTIKIVCKYCQGISDHEHANNDLMDFYANSLKKLQKQYEQSIRERRQLEEDQIKLYHVYDNLMEEHLKLLRKHEKEQTKRLRWLRWLKKL